MKELEIYLNDKINKLLASGSVFETKIKNDREELFALQKEVSQFKASNPDATYESVKDKLARIQEVSNLFLLEQEFKVVVNTIKEFVTMADMLKVDVEYKDPEHAGVVDFIRRTDNELFIVNNKGEIVMKDPEQERLYKEAMDNKKKNDSVYKEMFEMIPAAKVG